MMESLASPAAWLALLQIAVINVVLSGDNAVVIALACRQLDAKQAKRAFAVGAVGIIVLMTVLTAVAAYLLSLPYLQLIGCALLLWIGVKLLAAEEEADEDSVGQSSNFWEAVKIIIIADMVMSLDNVLGMAAAAKGQLWMLFVGMLITIPLILFCSAIIMKLMARFPILILVGAAILGWVAGDMAVGDPAVKHWVETNASYLEYVVPALGAAFVIVVGKLIEKKHKSGQTANVATAGEPS